MPSPPGVNKEALVAKSRRSAEIDPADVAQDYLARGVTGVLQLQDERGDWLLYVMQGEILAAQGPDEGVHVVRRLVNGGAISAGQADRLLADLAEGEPLENLLLGRVPEDLFLDLLTNRFRQNVLEFITLRGTPGFRPLEAVFVENIQTGHDSLELLESLRAQRARIGPLRGLIDRLVVRPGRAPPAQLAHARLLDLCEPERLLQGLLAASPLEDGATLVAISDMAERGVVELVDLEELQPQVGPADALDTLGPHDGVAAPAAGVTAAPESDDDLDEDTHRVKPVLSGDDELLDLMSEELQPLSDLGAAELARTALAQAMAAEAARAAARRTPAEPELEPELEPEPEPPATAPGAKAGTGGLTDARAAASSDTGDGADEGEDDPDVAHAIRRAREIEARREAARLELERDQDGVMTRPLGFEFDVPVAEDELAFFEDQDQNRGRGDGGFSTEQELLDRVDLSIEGMAAFQRAMQLPNDGLSDEDGPLAMAEATEEEAAHAVALNFSGPRLDERDIRRKLGVVNDVLAEIAGALDAHKGKGSGRVSVQILVDGPPTRYAPLFRAVQVDDQGRMDIERLVKNLRKRPEGERRRLLNESIVDLVQRVLSTSVEELDEDQVDDMLERIAGYQQRLGL